MTPKARATVVYIDTRAYTSLMKFLGVDFGTKRIGLALSDEGGLMAFPKGTIPNDGKALAAIELLVKQERVAAIVVGDAKAFGGKENDVTPEADAFADALAKIGVPVERIWEAWSSREASRFAPEGEGHNDAAAAAVILQRFLDTRAKE